MGMFNMEYLFKCSTRYPTSEHIKRVRYRFNTRRYIPYPQAIMYYFVCYINILITTFFDDCLKISDHFQKLSEAYTNDTEDGQKLL